MNLAEPQPEPRPITKENLAILRRVHARQEYLFSIGLIDSVDDWIGVGPSHAPMARRAVKKGLLERSQRRVTEMYRLSDAGKQELGRANHEPT